MERAARGLPLLFAHDQKQIIGRATGIRLEGDRLRAELRFRPGDAWDMVRDGDLVDVSIGYHVHEYEERDNGEVLATRWTPAEVSMVAVPADANAGIGRSIDEVEEMEAKSTVDRDALIKEGMRAENTRRSQIDRLFENTEGDYEELHQRCIADGLSLENALDALTKARAAEPAQEPIRKVSAEQKAEPDVRQGILDAIAYRSALYDWRTEEGRALRERNVGNEFCAMRMPDIARYCLASQGIKTRGLSDRETISKAIQTRAVTGAINSLTTDFTNLLADQLNKALLMGWELAAETYGIWTQTSSAADFKTGSRVHLSQFDRLTETAENVAYPLGEPDDFAEPFTVRKFGSRFSVSVEALTNDDLSGLSRVPQMLGRSASATVGDVAYDVVTANGLMSDAVALFAAGHNNLVTAGGPPDSDTINALRVLMAKQTDNHATEPHTLNIRMRYVLVPLELENAARIAVESTTNPADNQAAGIINPLAVHNLVVVADPRLSADSTVKWYGAAEAGTVEVVYLNGMQAPMVDSEPNFDRDGIEYRVRLYFTALATDWRGLAQNDGA